MFFLINIFNNIKIKVPIGIIDNRNKDNIILNKKIMEQEKGCSKCKKGLSNQQIGLGVLSLFILGTSIYGTIDLLKKIISFFF